MKFLLTITLFLMHCIGFCQDSVILKQNKSDQINIIRKEVAKEEKPIWVDLINNNLGAVLSAGVAILALFWGKEALAKKLLEKNITDKLSEMQSSNVVLAKECQKLIDKYYYKQREEVTFLSKEDVKQILEEINELFYKSFQCSSEAHTLCLLIKSLLEQLLFDWHKNHLNKEKNKELLNETKIYSKDVHLLLVSLMDKIKIYCTKVIEVPVKIKPENSHIVISKLKGLIPDSEVTELKSFNLGEITNKNATVFALFADSVNSLSNEAFLIKRAAHLALNYNFIPVIIQLFVNEIYVPVTIVNKNDFTDPNLAPYYIRELTLIGFKSQTKQTNTDVAPQKFYELVYSVFTSTNFVNSNFKKEKFQTEFGDCLNKNSKFDLNEIHDILIDTSSQTIKVTVEKKYVKELFKINKKWMKHVIKNPDFLKTS